MFEIMCKARTNTYLQVTFIQQLLRYWNVILRKRKEKKNMFEIICNARKNIYLQVTLIQQLLRYWNVISRNNTTIWRWIEINSIIELFSVWVISKIDNISI